MCIRAANADDSLIIAQIHIDSWKKTYVDIIPNSYINKITFNSRFEYWKKAITNNQLNVIVYSDIYTGEIKGWAAISSDRDEPNNNNIIEIQAIYIDPLFTNTGIGTKLIEYIFLTYGKKNVDSIVLWVLEMNTSAIRFYVKNKFKKKPIMFKNIKCDGIELKEIKLIASLKF